MDRDPTLGLRTGWVALAVVLAATVGARACQGAREEPGLLSPKIARFPPPPGAKVVTVAPAERFRAGGFKRWFLGTHYRRLWTTPIEVLVLDLDGVGGGLTPVRTGGFGQSISLRFAGGDGRTYAVRSLDKDPTKKWDDLLKNTVVDDVAQDLISALLPTGALACDPLMGALGILHAPHTLVVIPDDPRLGTFRGDFAGLVGTLQEVPSEGPDGTPGFAGSRRISGSEGFWERLERTPRNRVDAPGYLKARLFDILVGDKDRHFGQWRWARYPEGDAFTWRPIPEDRDQAFVHLDGFALALARMAVPGTIEFEDRLPNLVGITTAGWEMDRELLVGFDRSVWDSMARAVRTELPDTVIAGAVRRLPASYCAEVGTSLTRALESRRDELPRFVDRYYSLITRQAEITATDKDEYVECEHGPDGGLAVRIGLLPESGEPEAAPYFQRTFHPDDTKEVRVYCRDGDDRVRVRGADARITLRIDGGPGDDTLVNSSRAGRGRTRFYDFQGENQVQKGRGVYVDRRPFGRPGGTMNKRFAPDWGVAALTLPSLSASPDHGLVAGLVSTRQYFGWRKVPYASSHRVDLGLATDGARPIAAYRGQWRDALPGADAGLRLEYSGINVIRFYGFGNATRITGDKAFYQVEQEQAIVSPTLEFRAGANRDTASGFGSGAAPLRPAVTLAIGPVLKYSDTPADRNDDRFIGSFGAPVYGAGRFGQVGAGVEARFDTRDNPGYTTAGLLVQTGGDFYPGVWDVEEPFGGVRGAASAYLTPPILARPTLALRAGGKKVWGDYPFHEAAYLGGTGSLRGYHEDRFAGDASAYGNAELRFKLCDVKLVLPGELGLFAAADAGRVFLHEDRNADDWHTGVGGGFWLSVLHRRQTMSVAIMNGDDLTGAYLTAGFMY
jgi:hypothetical protein